MKILVVTPAPSGSRKGNRISALRWANILRKLGHTVSISEKYNGQRADLLIALHAYRSAASVKKFKDEQPGKPLILALTGTDLYNHIYSQPEALHSMELADRLILLQSLGITELPTSMREKARVICQSFPTPTWSVKPLKRVFEVCVIGHLREIKDPFCAARASRLLPPTSRIRITHLGQALEPSMQAKATQEMSENPRYVWKGGLPRWKAHRILARSRLMVISSVMEGGANVVSEALAFSVPVLASHIPGNVGLLGEGYPGYYPVGDFQALALLLHRAETEANFYQQLKKAVEVRKPLVEPERELRCWKELISEFS